MQAKTRRTLAATALTAAGISLALWAAPLSGADNHTTASSKVTKLPISAIEKIEQADGTYSSGVLTVDIDRSDLHVTGPSGVRFKDGFQITHELAFQSIGQHRAILNGELAVRPRETQHVIRSLVAHRLVFQSFHQHLYNLHPRVWFMHFRGVGAPKKLARASHGVIAAATATPLPQSAPKHPGTRLPVHRLAKILGGEATVGEHGVVTVDVPRRGSVRLGGIPINPDLNVASTIQFEPLKSGRTAAVPDFSMTADEVQKVTAIMTRRFGWEDGCLYNQETAEHPQLYFSHMFKVGSAVRLANEIRAALDRTDAQR